MYIVPMSIPQYCNKCPFGYCNYSFPFEGSFVSNIDGKENKSGTYGIVCNVEYQKSGKYTTLLRSELGKDIRKPEWCGLKEVSSDLIN